MGTIRTDMEIVTSAEYSSRVSRTLTEFHPMLLLALAIFRKPCGPIVRENILSGINGKLASRGNGGRGEHGAETDTIALRNTVR